MPTAGELERPRHGGKGVPAASSSGKSAVDEAREARARQLKRQRAAAQRARGHFNVSSYLKKLSDQTQTRHFKKGAVFTLDAVNALNDSANYLLDHIVEEAMAFARLNRHKTIGFQEIRGAIDRVIPPEMTQHALAEAEKAVARFYKSVEQDKLAKQAAGGSGKAAKGGSGKASKASAAAPVLTGGSAVVQEGEEEEEAS